MFSKIKTKLHSHAELPLCQDITPGESKPPSKIQILRNRKQFGVNLGGLYVQEKYIDDTFIREGFETELDGVTNYISVNGVEKTRQDLQCHWRSYIASIDWEWLRDQGTTCLRVPMGYWHVGPGFTRGTPFESVSLVYGDAAWESFKQLCKTADANDIAILFDLHGLPGGANKNEHSGMKLSDAGFWKSKKYQSLVIELYEFVTKEFLANGLTNIFGLQLSNENDYCDLDAQKEFVGKAINAIRALDPTMPIIISDSWDLNLWNEWLDKHSVDDSTTSGIVIDTHVYRCFDQRDRDKAVDKIIGDLSQDLNHWGDKDNDIIVGEYSCVLDTQSWDKSQGASRDELVKQYGQTESQLFKKLTMGAFFWTYKFKFGDGGEWGFVPMCERECLTNGQCKALSDGDLYATLEQKFSEHCSYWDSQNGNAKYEHWRYKEGFITGCNDSLAFAQLASSSVGSKRWINSRKREHVLKFKSSSQEFVWEWEHGYATALSLFQ